MAPGRAGHDVRVREAVVELARRHVDLARLVPSGRSLAVVFVLLALGLGSYVGARTTPLFAIDRVEVVGGPAAVRARVRDALSPLNGRSLVALRRDDVDAPLAAVPDVAGATYDRAFPNTLRVFVLAERPVAVVRRGRESWLVSARGRVLRPLPKGARAELPRVWVGRDVAVEVGDLIAEATAARSVRILAAAREALSAPVRTVRASADETTLLLRSGVELRLGREQDLRLKLEVASRIVPRLGPGTAYLDVAVPDRPVAGAAEAEVEVEGYGA